VGHSPSPPSAPSFAPSSVDINGQTFATTNRDSSGRIITNYTQTPQQQQQTTYDQAQIAELLPKMNVIDPNVQSQLQSQAQAIENNGLNNLNYNYGQGMNTAIADVAKRFGGLNNSGLAQETSNLNRNYGLSQANLANQYTGNLQALENNQLARQYNYLNALENNYNQNMSGIYQGYEQANQNTGIGNQYNQNLFADQQQIYNDQLNAQNNMYKNFGTALGNAGAAFIAA
jgi:hypothetical protein